MPTLADIVRYPLKGFDAESLEQVELTPGATLPHDRAWAIENGAGLFDPARPQHMKKKYFLMLAGHPTLARIAVRYDLDGDTAHFTFDDADTISIRLGDDSTHAPLFERLHALLGEDARSPLRIVHVPGQAMTDIPEPQISLINRASVADLSARMGTDIDPYRFRGNLIIEDSPAWAEFEWVGREMELGGTRLKAVRRIRRCAATSVDLTSGTRTADVPAALFEHYGHMDCGLYLDVIESGPVKTGDRLRLID